MRPKSLRGPWEKRKDDFGARALAKSTHGFCSDINSWSKRENGQKIEHEKMGAANYYLTTNE